MRGVELSPTLWGPTVPGQGGSQGWALLSFWPAQDGECPTRPEQGAGTWGDSNTLYQYTGQREGTPHPAPELPRSYLLPAWLPR